MRSLFRSVAQNAAEWMASPVIFLAAIGVIVLWLVLGPVYGYSDTWQLVVNTGTSVITFLMVFLLQNTQSRDTRAIQLKLDELLRSVKAARNELVRLEDLSDEDLEKLKIEFSNLAESSKSEAPHAGN
jgi:low affinity Fe/Cu permease